MKWFVYVDAEYYAETHIVEADSAEEASSLALEQTQGATYARYPDEGSPDGRAMGSEVTPACAIIPFDDVIFIGSPNRIASLTEVAS